MLEKFSQIKIFVGGDKSAKNAKLSIISWVFTAEGCPLSGVNKNKDTNYKYAHNHWVIQDKLVGGDCG